MIAAGKLDLERFARDAQRIVVSVQRAVVQAHLAVLLDEEQLVIGFIGRQQSDPVAVQSEAVQRRHSQHRMHGGVVLFLHPVSELAVEQLQADQVEFEREELVAHGPEEPFDFSFGGAITHGGVGQKTADAGDLDDFLGGIDRAVIDVE